MNVQAMAGIIAHGADRDSSDSTSSESDVSMFMPSTDDEDVSSEDDQQIAEDILFPVMQIILHGRPRVRVENFVNTALGKGNNEFREDFRISREIFDELLGALEASGHIPIYSSGRPCKSACLSLLLTLWFLGNRVAHRDLANLFHVSFSSVFRVIRRVIDWMITLMPQHIVWPQGNDIERISQCFQERAGIAHCIGAIDGSHIPVIKPVHEGESYFNRKQSYSIILQGTVDCNMKFINIYCGDPGSFHDVRVWRRSDLFYQAETNLANVFPRATFLLWDKGYIGVGKKWIVTPFRDNHNLLLEQTDFNRRVSSTRVVVEQAFGILKNRFRRLKLMEFKDLYFMISVVLASCVLHNICLGNGDDGHDLVDDENDLQNDEGNAGNHNENIADSDDSSDDDNEDVEEPESRQERVFRQMYPDVR